MSSNMPIITITGWFFRMAAKLRIFAALWPKKEQLRFIHWAAN